MRCTKQAKKLKLPTANKQSQSLVVDPGQSPLSGHHGSLNLWPQIHKRCSLWLWLKGADITEALILEATIL